MQSASDPLLHETPTVDRQAAKERQLLLINELFRGTAWNCIVGGLLVFLLWGQTEPAKLLGWYALLVAVSVYRLGMLRRRKRLQMADGPDDVVQLGLFSGVFASALVSGAVVFLSAQSTDAVDMMLIATLLGGLGAGMLGSLGADFRLYAVYLVCLLAPGIGRLFTGAEPVQQGLAVTLSALLVMLLIAGRGHAKRLEQWLRAGLRNRELAEQMALVNAEAADSRRQLDQETEKRQRAESEIHAAARRLHLVKSRLQAETQQRLAEERRVRQQANQSRLLALRLQTIIDNSAVGIVTLGQDGRILTANPAAQRLLGGPETLLTGRELSVFLPGVKVGSDHTAWQAAGLQLGPDRRLPVSLAINPIDGEQAYVCVLWDDSETEQALEALSKAKAVVESEHRAKSEFMSDMGHELKTPLNAILGFVQLLEVDPANPLSETQRASTKEISKAGWHLLSLINDVLNQAQIEAGRLKLRVQEVAPDALVDDVIKLMAPLAASHAVTMESAIADSGEQLFADPMRFKQVLINLLSNAIKYNREGGRVVVALADGRRGFCRLVVSDTGRGLTEQQQATVFDRFDRAGPEDPEIDGSGIGLSVCRMLVRAMGGEIGVDSKPDRGSDFWLELPAVQCESNPQPVAASS